MNTQVRTLKRSFGMVLMPLLIGVSCATNNLTVTSKPSGAEVYLIPEGQQPLRLGETPLSIATDQVTQTAKGSATVLVAKEGFEAERFLVPKISFSSNVQISTELKEQASSPMCQAADETLKRVVRDVAEVQNLTYQKQYDRALFMIDALIAKYPQIAVFYDLQGNIFYLQRVTDRALSAYQRSLKIDPTSSETQRMVQKLESILGSRMPTGSSR